jgi:glyoxylase-like metal-dependent hydrolase (beta-lactamase superfamily II)
MSIRIRAPFVTIVALALGGGAAVAQRDFSKVEIKTTKIAEGIWMLEGAGGNIGVCAGEDGVLLIDDQFAPLSDKILTALKAVSEKPPRFVLNTHWHGDHVGGNENLAKAGATIVAHDRVRARMSVDQTNAFSGRVTPAAPRPALPLVTFADSLTFHVNGEDVTCFHVEPAHTDGDVVVWFPKANVIHTGDCLFNGLYPVIDISSGGRVSGMIAAADRILSIARPDTRIIPGHGPLATRQDLEAFRDMMKTSRDRVFKMVSEGKTLQQIQEAKPLADLDAKWGQGAMKADTYIETLVRDATRK